MQYSQIVDQVASTLEQAGIEPYRHEALVLVAYALGIEVRELQRLIIMRQDIPLSSDATAQLMQRIETLTQRRAQREPLQHILGVAPFRYLTLQVGRGVFIPRPETELVVQAGLDWLEHQHQVQNLTQPRVVDLCAGSGAIGLAVLTERVDSQVWAVELDNDALQWTQRNAKTVCEQYESTHAAQRYHLIQGDATQAAKLDGLRPIVGAIDLVLSNPPYIPLDTPVTQLEVRDYDPQLALYGGSADGTAIPQHVLDAGYQLLASGGCMIMEHDASQGAVLARYAQRIGFTHVEVCQDYAGRDRFIQAIK
ncbi:release factor glutamine methyltransferase [Galliscardovia ingluviei]|uniref:Release factor glutamine methyltransferase n=1 Tax=Galliscardovia ingluviei TaxID=1769422 RepID=A0A8J3EY64_9BIFI|nr:peptide chain release factor N(5)-glutamine methyltransferase [Galliscardovia ingluviei]GGI13882.1 release factor glutamine methyltransferase [Galliscardovia ingluviei]